ncbi:CoA ester lyase [Cupriavidus cauae]|uniref:HpcH/HpaI aldolase/citrate lyase family protein n=1 Tax=Cupriavidus cauae TaxID=2608999 RepID=UPI0022443054|nr:CoA ester lyase [Cupriavidus cauae]UZN51291.1 CoA ester lyase [Cupriavidus cauae]
MTDDSLRLRRSVLYVPAANARAIDKSAALPCDAIVFDLEDAVSPAMKSAARAQLGQALSGRRSAGQEIVLRVNALGTAEFAQDLMLAASARVDAVLLPKVGDDSDVVAFARACAALAWDKPPALWAMVETPQAIHRLDAIVAAGRAATPRLDCLVIGTNDLAKDTGVFAGEERRYLMPWLMQAVLAAKRYGVDILDGVWNDFGDQAGYAAELTQSVRMAFDGKTLIHPSQIDAANAAFAPSAQQVAEAERIAAAFAANENADAGVINLDGRMVERLHLEQALRLLARHRAIVQAEQRRGGAAATATAANAPNSPNAANAAKV